MLTHQHLVVAFLLLFLSSSLSVSGVDTNKYDAILNVKAVPPPPPATINMNGMYVIGNPNEESPTPYSTDYGTKGAQFFEVYSNPLPTVYGEVYWTMQDAVMIPSQVIQKFANKTIAIIGYEADQVFRTANGDVSVPIYWSYNHHYCAWLLSTNNKLVFVADNYHKNHKGFNHGAKGYWMPVPISADNTTTPYPTDIPTNQFISEGNGGEYRKSYHGYPRGYAQLLYSPEKFQIQPMQIDTHNRDYNGPGFKAGILPKSSRAPPDATYSGLLECPCTTRITKTWNNTYETQLNATCAKDIVSAEECFTAVAIIGIKPTSKEVVSDEALPQGCSLLSSRSGNVTAVFNSHSSTTQCGVGLQIYGYASSLVDVKLLLDSSVVGGEATITLTGPADVWFGVGFNGQAMSDLPYTIVVDGTGAVTEHKLADHAPGNQLAAQVKVVSSTVDNGQRTVVLTRPFTGLTPDHYTFDPKKSNLPFINAIGSVSYFSYHKSKATATLILTGTEGTTCICDAGLKGYINGIVFTKYCVPEPNGDLVNQKNPTCTIQSYVGGLGCCHHKNILLDADQPVDNRVDHVSLKFRFYYQEYVPPSSTNPVASHYNLHRFYYQTEAWAGEYDVVNCAPGTPPSECIQVITSRWMVKDMLDCNLNKDPNCVIQNGIQLVYAGGHCHAPSCLSLELYNYDTGDLLCRQVPIIGQGGSDKFDEVGYVAIPPCLWGEEDGLVSPVLLQLDTKLLSVKRNNNTDYHYGEMASWQMRGIFL